MLAGQMKFNRDVSDGCLRYEIRAAWPVRYHVGGDVGLLSPVQAVMIPISERYAEYANKVASQLKAIGVRVEVDARNEKMNAKIREHAMQKVPFLLVVGDKEAEAGKVNVRTRGKEKTEDLPAGEFVEKINGGWLDFLYLLHHRIALKKLHCQLGMQRRNEMSYSSGGAGGHKYAQSGNNFFAGAPAKPVQPQERKSQTTCWLRTRFRLRNSE